MASAATTPVRVVCYARALGYPPSPSHACERSVHHPVSKFAGHPSRALSLSQHMHVRSPTCPHAVTSVGLALLCPRPPALPLTPLGRPRPRHPRFPCVMRGGTLSKTTTTASAGSAGHNQHEDDRCGVEHPTEPSEDPADMPGNDERGADMPSGPPDMPEGTGERGGNQRVEEVTEAVKSGESGEGERATDEAGNAERRPEKPLEPPDMPQVNPQTSQACRSSQGARPPSNWTEASQVQRSTRRTTGPEARRDVH